MANFSEQLEAIKTLILSTAKSEKSFAYSTLQHLQEQSSTDESLIRSLVEFIPSVVPPIIGEIRDSDSDEEIVTLALKCLGFIIYHPSLVAAIPMEYVHQVLESLARLIKMAKVKVVCNLGVWCISIQQLDASSLACHFDSLLMAIVHSLDNPVGSLSMTFEGIQAVMKLSTQISEKMRDSSSIWAAPIYRRLLSADKRERDMCIRCLLKIKSLIIPSPLALSKAIARDLKLKLLPGMKELLKQGKKVEALQAWGWFICILGSYSLKTRQLVNEMLKIPEQTFSDPDPQVQIASQVAWEGLIDALVYVPSNICGPATIHQSEVQQIKGKSADKTEVNGGIVQGGGHPKGLKLIMTPLIGIMTSKAELSVRSSCLNTWCYLLHKLGSLVNDPHILDTVLEPMLKAVFNMVIEDRNIWVWRFCIHLLQDFVQSKIRCVNNVSHDDASHNLSARTGHISCPVSGECSLKNYPVKWLPWDCSQTDFFVRMIRMAFNQAVVATSCLEIRRVICDATLKMFHMFLKGVQVDFTKPSTTYDTVMQSMNAILAIVKMVSESALHEEDATNDFQVTCLYFIEAITQELDPSILGSPLYRIALDIDVISNFQHTGGARLKVLIGNSHLGFTDNVLPVIYLSVSYFSMVVQISSKATSSKRTLQEAHRYFYNLLCSYDSLEVLQAVVTVLYAYVGTSSLPVWITIARGLRDCIANDMMLLKIQPGSTGSVTVCHLLLYPFVICSLQKPLIMQKDGNPVTLPPVSLEKSTLEQVREMWVSLYCLVNSIHVQESSWRNHFAEDLCSSLNCFLQRMDTGDYVPEVYASSNSQDHFCLLCADVAKSILQNVHLEKVTPEAIKSGYTGSSGINNCLEFIAMLMKLLWTKNSDASAIASVLRLLTSLIQLVGCLQWQEDIVCFTKAFYDTLLPWLSGVEAQNESISHELQQLWIEIIKTLQRSWPAINFDSSFLKLQAPLLEKTLDHPSSSISDPTITFWNSTYGDQTKLDFPPCLLRVLDKLSRLGKIKIQKKTAPTSPTEHDSSLRSVDTHPQYKVTSALNTCSKRVKLLQNVVDDACKKKPPSCPKRKGSELTERQKEVRRAQQGRTRDSSGHGPGIRTYTSVDFSQGNEDSQDSEDIRDPELILDLLRRVA